MTDRVKKIQAVVLGKNQTSIYVKFDDVRMWIPYKALHKDSIVSPGQSGDLIIKADWASKHFKKNGVQ
jgi:hypothetical protein